MNRAVILRLDYLGFDVSQVSTWQSFLFSMFLISPISLFGTVMTESVFCVCNSMLNMLARYQLILLETIAASPGTPTMKPSGTDLPSMAKSRKLLVFQHRGQHSPADRCVTYHVYPVLRLSSRIALLYAVAALVLFVSPARRRLMPRLAP